MIVGNNEHGNLINDCISIHLQVRDHSRQGNSMHLFKATNTECISAFAKASIQQLSCLKCK